jgi:hypothetical protein
MTLNALKCLFILRLSSLGKHSKGSYRLNIFYEFAISVNIFCLKITKCQSGVDHQEFGAL